MDAIGSFCAILVFLPFYLAGKALKWIWKWMRYAWWHMRNPGVCPHCGGDGYTMEKPYGKVICGECND